jgi:hypothetical protein
MGEPFSVQPSSTACGRRASRLRISAAEQLLNIRVCLVETALQILAYEFADVHQAGHRLIRQAIPGFNYPAQ